MFILWVIFRSTQSEHACFRKSHCADLDGRMCSLMSAAWCVTGGFGLYDGVAHTVC